MNGDGSPDDFLSREELHALLAAEASAPAPAPQEGDLVGTELLERPRVLLVCRRGLEMRWLTSRLAANGAEVTCAKSPLAALELLRERSHRAVVSDVDLWARGGAALLQRARQVGPGIRVLLLTGKGRGFRLAGREMDGPWGYLGRPVEPPALEAAVTALLSTSEAPVALASGLEVGERPLPAVSIAPPGARSAGAAGTRRGELAWLRFCLALTRELRSRDDVEQRVARVLSAAREALGAREVGVRFPLAEGMELRCQGTQSGLSSLSSSLAGSSPPAAGTVLLGRLDAASACLALRGLDIEVESARAEYAADVAALLPAALRDEPARAGARD